MAIPSYASILPFPDTLRNYFHAETNNLALGQDSQNLLRQNRAICVISGAKSSQNHRFKTGQIETRTSYPIHGQHVESAMRFLLYFEKDTSCLVSYRSPWFGFTGSAPGSFANAVTARNQEDK